MKRIIFISGCFFCVFFEDVQAQSIGPSVLNVAGGSKRIASNTYEWSVGEMTMVHTAESATISVTQGILQPMPALPSGIKPSVITQESLNIFPVPATTMLNIQPFFENGGTLLLSLLDASGRTVSESKVSLNSGKEQQQLNIGDLATGNYLLLVHYESKGAVLQTNYKIQKTN